MNVWDDESGGVEASLTDAELDLVLSGGALDPGASAQARALADVLGDLTSPAPDGPAPGESAALAAFRRAHVASLDEHRADPRRSARRAKVGGGVVASVIALTLVGGTAAAASLSGNLPEGWPGHTRSTPATSLSAETVSTPTATPRTAPTVRPKPTPARTTAAEDPSSATTAAAKPDKTQAPAASSSSQYGLCKQVLRTGARTLSPSSAAHRALTAAAAARGQTLVDYCSGVVHPGKAGSSSTPAATETPGKSAVDKPNGQSEGKPATTKGKPADPPGKPEKTDKALKATAPTT